MIFLGFCGPHKYGIKEDVNPKEDVHVFLHPKLIISGFKYENVKKKVNEINNEKMFFDFFIPSGDQEIDVRAAYTSGIYAFSSVNVPLSIKAGKGDVVFVCAKYREVGTRHPSGGIVRVLVTPEVLYLKSEAEKNEGVSEKGVNATYFSTRCSASSTTDKNE